VTAKENAFQRRKSRIVAARGAIQIVVSFEPTAERNRSIPSIKTGRFGRLKRICTAGIQLCLIRRDVFVMRMRTLRFGIVGMRLRIVPKQFFLPRPKVLTVPVNRGRQTVEHDALSHCGILPDASASFDTRSPFTETQYPAVVFWFFESRPFRQFFISPFVLFDANAVEALAIHG